jgi:hypothetical protein
MECLIAVPVVDQGIEHLADVLQPHLEELSRRLSREYGGRMLHLWIDVELSPSHQDLRPPWPFRLQKRVSLARFARRHGLPVPDAPDPTNVGHFSVRPGPAELADIELHDIPAHVIGLIHRESAFLEQLSARLGGFDAAAFRQDILRYQQEIARGPPEQPGARSES